MLNPEVTSLRDQPNALSSDAMKGPSEKFATPIMVKPSILATTSGQCARHSAAAAPFGQLC